MSTVTTVERTTEAPGDQRVALGDQRVVLGGVGWEGYEAILKLKGDRRYPKLAYLDGSVIFVSPSYLHEQMARSLGLLVSVVAEGLRTPYKSSRSTTFRRQSDEGGGEADESFYFKDLHRLRGKRDIDLRIDPPPDLAIEVVVSHDADDAVEVWRRFGVPEVWVCQLQRVTVLRLGGDGTYVEIEHSVIFPTLAAEEIHFWATREYDDELTWLLALRRWVAEVLVPRGRELAANPTPPKDRAENPEQVK